MKMVERRDRYEVPLRKIPACEHLDTPSPPRKTFTGQQ